ncbi:hypothetical protein AMECASPLE_006186 [Ameca splendens]|uniref:Uncharacterized protein n=1 Tax=Ameca splendens TaxID=208324 RepID=A0ABV0YAB0_9TELE
MWWSSQSKVSRSLQRKGTAHCQGEHPAQKLRMVMGQNSSTAEMIGIGKDGDYLCQSMAKRQDTTWTGCQCITETHRSNNWI